MKEIQGNGVKHELGHHFIDSIDFGIGRRIANMASRTQLGLRSKQWLGYRIDHRRGSSVDGAYLTNSPNELDAKRACRTKAFYFS